MKKTLADDESVAEMIEKKKLEKLEIKEINKIKMRKRSKTKELFLIKWKGQKKVEIITKVIFTLERRRKMMRNHWQDCQKSYKWNNH